MVLEPIWVTNCDYLNDKIHLCAGTQLKSLGLEFMVHTAEKWEMLLELSSALMLKATLRSLSILENPWVFLSKGMAFKSKLW